MGLQTQASGFQGCFGSAFGSSHLHDSCFAKDAISPTLLLFFKIFIYVCVYTTTCVWVSEIHKVSSGVGVTGGCGQSRVGSGNSTWVSENSKCSQILSHLSSTSWRTVSQGADHAASRRLTCQGARLEVVEVEPRVSLWAYHTGYGTLSLWGEAGRYEFPGRAV